MQQVQTVAAHYLVVGIDLHGREEGVDRGAQGGHGLHRGVEILGLDGGVDLRLGGGQRVEQRGFAGVLGKLGVRAEFIGHAVLFLGLGQDVVGALEALHQVLAILGRQHAAQGLGTLDQKRQIIRAGHRQTGVDHVVPQPFVAQVNLEPVMEKRQQVVRKVGLVRGDLLDPGGFVFDLVQHRPEGRAEDAVIGDLLQQLVQQGAVAGAIGIDPVTQDLRIEQTVQAEPQIVVQNQTDHPKCGTAQRKGILRSRRLFVDRPEACQQVDLVGQRHGDRHRGRGHVVRRAKRRIMLLRGGGDLVREARGRSVIAPHKPLKFREFIDHFGRQIGFGHPRGLFGQRRIRADHRRDFPRQRGDAVDAFALAAQLVVEGHVVQAVLPFAHARLGDALVVFPEEPRIRQTRCQHLLVARQDRRAIVAGFAVGHGDELLDPARLGIADREELLVFLHRGLQHLRRQAQEFRANVAHQDDRPFDQARDLGQKALVLDHLKAGGERHVGGVLPDVIGAFLRVQHHMGALQLGGVIFEPGDGEAIRRVEPMPRRPVARGDAVDVQRHHFGPGLGRQYADDRMQRPYPFQTTSAPTHGFGPGEIANNRCQHLGDDLGRRATGLLDHGDIDLALLVVLNLQILARNTGPAQEALDRLFRRIDARAFTFLAQRRRGIKQPVHRQRQPARRVEGGGPGIGQTGLDQTVRHPRLEVLRGARLHPGGDFFREEFDQKVGHSIAFDVSFYQVSRGNGNWRSGRLGRVSSVTFSFRRAAGGSPRARDGHRKRPFRNG